LPSVDEETLSTYYKYLTARLSFPFTAHYPEPTTSLEEVQHRCTVLVGPLIRWDDEPTGNLDSVAAEGVFSLFELLHRQRGMTIVLITHDPGFAHRAERLVSMQDGRITDDGLKEGVRD
jgi:predicted ABC-type transport system involved in lysophospholipase L1 biosynthesis ATPase subunit